MSYFTELISILLIASSVGLINGQFGEIASVVNGILSPVLVGTGAGGAASSAAANLLNNIGTLYQIAQGALQLTGTGVGILNQASEGKWFNTVLDGALNSNREIQEQILSARESAPDYAQLGINFPAPSPGDYDHEEFIEPEGLISISGSGSATDKIITITTTTTDAPMLTLFPEEKIKTGLEEMENRNGLSTNLIVDSIENENVKDHVGEKKKFKLGGAKISPNTQINEKQMDNDPAVTQNKEARLQRLIALLRESNLTETDLHEMARLLEKMQKPIDSKSPESIRIHTTNFTIAATTTAPFPSIAEISDDDNSKPPLSNMMPVQFRLIRYGEVADNEDNDLLSTVATTSIPQAKAVRIKWRPNMATIRPRKQFPRRTAYAAPLPSATPSTSANFAFMQSEQLQSSFPNAPFNFGDVSKTQLRPIHFTGEVGNQHSEVPHSKILTVGNPVIQQPNFGIPIKQSSKPVAQPKILLTQLTPSVHADLSSSQPPMRPHAQAPTLIRLQPFHIPHFTSSNYHVPFNPNYINHPNHSAQQLYRRQFNTFANPALPSNQNQNFVQTSYNSFG